MSTATATPGISYRLTREASLREAQAGRPSQSHRQICEGMTPTEIWERIGRHLLRTIDLDGAGALRADLSLQEALDAPVDAEAACALLAAQVSARNDAADAEMRAHLDLPIGQWIIEQSRYVDLIRQTDGSIHLHPAGYRGTSATVPQARATYWELLPLATDYRCSSSRALTAADSLWYAHLERLEVERAEMARRAAEQLARLTDLLPSLEQDIRDREAAQRAREESIHAARIEYLASMHPDWRPALASPMVDPVDLRIQIQRSISLSIAAQVAAVEPSARVVTIDADVLDAGESIQDQGLPIAAVPSAIRIHDALIGGRHALTTWSPARVTAGDLEACSVELAVEDVRMDVTVRLRIVLPMLSIED